MLLILPFTTKSLLAEEAKSENTARKVFICRPIIVYLELILILNLWRSDSQKPQRFLQIERYYEIVLELGT